jgi:hypothetical protein
MPNGGDAVRRTTLVCSVGLLGACAHADIEEQQQPAGGGPTVSYPYANAQEYRDASVKADDYCAQRYKADAQPAADYSDTGGEATFLCITK